METPAYLLSSNSLRKPSNEKSSKSATRVALRVAVTCGQVLEGITLAVMNCLLSPTIQSRFDWTYSRTSYQLGRAPSFPLALAF
jgi:hypothetical protein